MQFPTNSVNTSAKYKVINTEKVIDVFQSKGYELREASFKRARKIENQAYAKHLLRFKIPLESNDFRIEITYTNSYDGSSSSSLVLGVFRKVCSNGLMVGKNFGGVNVRHVGDAVTKLNAGIDQVIDQVPRLVEDINRLTNKQLTTQDIIKAVSYIETSLGKNSDLVARVLTITNRVEDSGFSAWVVLNKLQEFILQGQYRYQNNKGNFAKSRAVKSIDRTVELNRLVWDAVASVA